MAPQGASDSKPANVLAGPGLIKRPKKVAEALDAKLAEMVRELERVANCPEPAFDLPQGLSPSERIERFCEALAEVGEPLMADLVNTYGAACRSERLDPDGPSALLEQRARLLVDYFAELAKVHGVAFATDDAPPPRAAVDRALAALDHSLRQKLDAARARLPA